MNRTRISRITYALGLAAALTLTGCAAGGSETTDQAAAGDAAAAAAPVTLKVGLISPGTSGVPIYVAMEEGFFEAGGVKVTTEVLQGGATAAMAALAQGSVDILVGGATEFVQYTAEGVVEGKIFAQAEDNFYDLVAADGIESLADLEGKTVGLSAPNGADDIYLRAVLDEAGVDRDSITFVTSGTAVQRLSALEAGAADAVAVSHLNRGTSSGVGTVLISAEESPIQFPGSVFFASDETIATQDKALSAFTAALGEAADWTRANPAEAVQICITGTSATEGACKGAITLASDPAFAGDYTWSSTFAVNEDGITSAIKVVAEYVTDKASTLKASDLVAASIAG